MRIAVIGLGSIAQKAYLPTLAARPGVDLHLMTRSRERLDAVADTYRVPHDRRFTGVEQLLVAGLDAAFVHVPTEAHRTVVERLLTAGVPVYVDKPLDSTLVGARYLVEQAQRANVLLRVGFNRRFAPAYQQARELPRDLINVRKNQNDGAGPVREIVFDDFIHVVDTLRFLLPGRVERTFVSGRIVDGELHHVCLTLSGPGFSAVGSMHRLSGAKQERLEVAGDRATLEVLDLDQVFVHQAGMRTLRPADGWSPVARRRGFEQACTAFLDAVRAGEPDAAGLADALRTHELCENVVNELSPS
ncbi:MAG TPA: Gfo/Idh/MocA family oxidoreductase [Pseudonocardiaceae bacterium]|nr:Gfo/Idh/MocA family oxidoreductase [Pseudonocardiaceae bacterium]